jgi:transcriptional regulator with XRE-family HTH domain
MAQREAIPVGLNNRDLRLSKLQLRGRDIYLLRMVRQFSQEQLAERSGISVPVISSIENERRPLRADRELRLIRALFP